MKRPNRRMIPSLLRAVFFVFLALLVLEEVSWEVRAQAAVKLSDRTIEVRGERYHMHEVARKETLYSIARAYGVSREAIIRTNGLVGEQIRRKQTLLIPTGQKKKKAEEHVTMEEEGQGPKYPITIEGGGDVSQEPRADTDTGQRVRRVRAFDQRGTLHIALMLPTDSDDGESEGMGSNFADFYRGVLMGLNALKHEGISTDLKIFNTGNSADKVQSDIRQEKLKAANLIIGPVYPETFGVAAQYAMQEGIPIVSPLGEVGEENNPYVFEAAPPRELMYDKMFRMFGEDHIVGDDGISRVRNTIIIEHAEWADSSVLELVRQAFVGQKPNVHTMAYHPLRGNKTRSEQLDHRLMTLLDRDAENVLFVPVYWESAVEEVLSRLGSINIKEKDRYRVTVVGTSNWWRFDNLNLDLYFKLNVHYPTSYHADRANQVVADFYREYIDAFGSVPTLFSFRGYDVVKYFGSAMRRFGTDMPAHVVATNNGGYQPELLQVDYIYLNHNGQGKYRNLNWPVVNYRPGYTIEVK